MQGIDENDIENNFYLPSKNTKKKYFEKKKINYNK